MTGVSHGARNAAVSKSPGRLEECWKRFVWSIRYVRTIMELAVGGIGRRSGGPILRYTLFLQ